jgi:hypothetical protein
MTGLLGCIALIAALRSGSFARLNKSTKPLIAFVASISLCPESALCLLVQVPGSGPSSRKSRLGFADTREVKRRMNSIGLMTGGRPL